MPASHLLILVVFSGLVSAVFSFLLREEPKERVRFGLYAFFAFIATTLVVSWLMSPFPL